MEILIRLQAGHHKPVDLKLEIPQLTLLTGRNSQQDFRQGQGPYQGLYTHPESIAATIAGQEVAAQCESVYRHLSEGAVGVGEQEEERSG